MPLVLLRPGSDDNSKTSNTVSGNFIRMNPVAGSGNPQFKGVLEGIAMLVRQLPVPVMVKEIGAGISSAVARRLIDVGTEDLERHLLAGLIKILQKRDNQRIDLFAGGASGHPDAYGRIAMPILHQDREDGFL